MANTATQTLLSAFDMAGTQTTKSIAAARKARRAYIGMYGAAYEAITQRSAPTFSGIKLDTLIAQGTKIESQLEDGVQDFFSNTPKFVRRATPCGMATTVGLMPKRDAKRVVALEAELTELNAELVTLTKAAKKTTKAAVKKTVKKVAPKTAVKKTTKPTKVARHIAYWENVKAYDANASEDIARKIVNHCGIALNSKDAKFVACSDETERNTVRDSWLVKKLGVEASSEALDAKVLAVCETMKADRMKCRVTFYYLLAKTEGKLASL